jgi:hypothetical protein
MDDRFIKLALDAGLLNYVDHETPRHYFINGHADLKDVAKFAELVVLETRQEAADEIERLREEMADLKYKKTYLERAYMAARRILDSKGIHMDYFLSRADYDAALKEGE